jgi:ATP-dependent DNA helicase PIF1
MKSASDSIEGKHLDGISSDGGVSVETLHVTAGSPHGGDVKSAEGGSKGENEEDKEEEKVIKLNEEQQEVVDLIGDGCNVFLTGQAGTGKSEVIKYLTKLMTERGKVVAVTAMTGIAGLNVGGMTLHRWAGVELGEGEPEQLLRKVKKKPYAVKNWRNTSILIVDEVSMLTPDFMLKLDYVAKGVRAIRRAFGGLQILFCGDFCQLGPVKTDVFCFEGDVWPDCDFVICHLKKNMRQSDPLFQKILSEIRMGLVTDEARKVLESRVGAKVGTADIKPTKLYSLTDSANAYNVQQLNALEDSEIHEFKAVHWVNGFKKKYTAKEQKDFIGMLNKTCQARETLHLKKGAQVMLIHNYLIDAGLANGSRGVVTGFDHGRPNVKFLNGIEVLIKPCDWELHISDMTRVCRRQMPLILAWAGTIHKCQGLTIDCIEADLGSTVFADGQFYTALSRVRTLEGLSLTDLDFDRVLCNPKAREFYANH